MSINRTIVAILVVAATGVIAARARTSAEEHQVVQPLPPMAIADWTGVDAGPLDPETERTLGADVVVNRTYYTDGGFEAGLYVAYYAQQRPGVSIHSPLHCLPGTGWDVLSNSTIELEMPDGTSGAVRRLVAQKSAAQMLILYWYDIQGRMVANDFLSRAYLLQDRLRSGRNEAALVRLAIPANDSLPAAERRGIALARALAPHLRPRGPS